MVVAGSNAHTRPADGLSVCEVQQGHWERSVWAGKRNKALGIGIRPHGSNRHTAKNGGIVCVMLLRVSKQTRGWDRRGEVKA